MVFDIIFNLLEFHNCGMHSISREFRDDLILELIRNNIDFSIDRIDNVYAIAYIENGKPNVQIFKEAVI